MSKATRWMAFAALAGIALYASLWVGFRQHWGWQDTVDSSALDALHRYGVAHPGWVACWRSFCNILGPNGFRVIGGAAAVVALVQRNVRAALFLVVSIGLCESVTSVAKGLAHRPRPATALATAPSSSFPSGHAVAVMVGVLALLTVFVPLLGERGRMAATLVGAAVVVAIGFGRVALNVHHPSDVLAGWALGYVFYCLCLLLLNPSRSRPEQRRPDRV